MSNSTTTSNEQFQNLPTTKLGTAAETFIKNYLRSIGYTVYWAVPEHGSSLIDGMGFSGATNSILQKNLFEVKCKSKTRHGTYSIHENDLIVYEELQYKLGMEMVVIYLDHETGEVNCITPAGIRRHTAMIVYDEREKKKLVYFNGTKSRTTLTPEVVQELRKLALDSKTYNK